MFVDKKDLGGWTQCYSDGPVVLPLGLGPNLNNDKRSSTRRSWPARPLPEGVRVTQKVEDCGE